jgi:hypothetical protein
MNRTASVSSNTTGLRTATRAGGGWYPDTKDGWCDGKLVNGAGEATMLHNREKRFEIGRPLLKVTWWTS